MAEPEPSLELGIALHQQGKLADAERIYRDILRQTPDDFDALHLSGLIALQTGRTKPCVELIGRAIGVDANVAAAHNNLGYALLILNRHAEAVASFDRAIALQPGFPEAYNNRGIGLSALKRYAEAVASYDKAITLKPDYAEAYSNRGIGLLAIERHAEAVESSDMAVALRPDSAEAHFNRGNGLRELGRFEEAVESFDRAIALKPGHAEAYNNRGNGLVGLNRHAEALASYEKAIALNPDLEGARSNQSVCHLAMGDYERAWVMYEWRWKAGLALPRPGLPGRPWLGDVPIDGKTILVVAEQGFGDSLQFCRYVPMLAARATVVLVVPRPLRRLLSGLEGVARTVVSDDPLPAADAWIPMMSLPLAFRTTLASIPVSIPYLHADPGRSSAWRQRLAAFSGLKVGLVWAGSPKDDNPKSRPMDRRRSITLQHYAPLAAIPGLCLISLQKGAAAAQTRTPPEGMVVHDWTAELDDFADTAALVEALDLVISVDTAVVHLAGGLGKPVWVLNRYDQCWRWLLNRTDSPWYPSARLFQQQSPGDWPRVIDAVAEALRTEIG
jgi:tetratricopeptide (TPR) repeat protein